jgi:hypothetical protein
MPNEQKVLEAHLRLILTTGANMGVAQVLTQHNAPLNEVRSVLTIARESALRALIFWNSEGNFTITFQRLEQFGVGPQTLSAIEAGLFHFQGQLREFYCSDSPRKPQLQQIYNLGVNLGWGFAFCVYSHEQNDIRAALERARSHANAAQIFNNPEASITPAYTSLLNNGVGPQTGKVIQGVTESFQRELGDTICRATL